jgi:hypothetical protein
MKPTLGRIVHITWPDGIESSAIITRTRRDSIGMLYADQIDAFIAIPADRWGNRPVPSQDMDEESVDLQVFGLAIVYPLYNVPLSVTAKPLHWHWPERDA